MSHLIHCLRYFLALYRRHMTQVHLNAPGFGIYAPDSCLNNLANLDWAEVRTTGSWFYPRRTFFYTIILSYQSKGRDNIWTLYVRQITWLTFLGSETCFKDHPFIKVGPISSLERQMSTQVSFTASDWQGSPSSSVFAKKPRIGVLVD